jgi:glyoxylase-like metal-dependent hydrolase (beta-lactamase superfamily II)
VVDAGTPRSWRSLLEVLDRLGRKPSDVAAIVLTHAHFDHIGFAERARRELGIEVWVHTDDVPLTRHPLQYSHERSRIPYFLNPAAAPILGALIAQRALLPPPIAAVRRFGENGCDEALAVPGAPRALPTPGHTLGHCALALADRNAVIVGDAIVALDPYTGKRGPRLVAGAATADAERNLASLDAIAETGAKTVLSGHGEPLTGGAEHAVERARDAGMA